MHSATYLKDEILTHQQTGIYWPDFLTPWTRGVTWTYLKRSDVVQRLIALIALIVCVLYCVANYVNTVENNKTSKTNNLPVIKHSVPSGTSSKGPGRQTRWTLLFITTGFFNFIKAMSFIPLKGREYAPWMRILSTSYSTSGPSVTLRLCSPKWFQRFSKSSTGFLNKSLNSFKRTTFSLSEPFPFYPQSLQAVASQ